MLKLIKRRWWAILLQGILLIVLSIYIFNNPINALKGISAWIGIFIFFTGFIGMISWLVADRDEREYVALLWCLLTMVFGALMLFHIIVTAKIVTVIFGLWMVFFGLHFIESGLVFKKHQPFRWATVIAGFIFIIAAALLIFNIGTGIGVSLFIGVQILLAGIALVIFSFAKKEMIDQADDNVKYMNPELFR